MHKQGVWDAQPPQEAIDILLSLTPKVCSFCEHITRVVGISDRMIVVISSYGIQRTATAQ